MIRLLLFENFPLLACFARFCVSFSAAHRVPAAVKKKWQYLRLGHIDAGMTSETQPNDCGFNHIIKADVRNQVLDRAVKAMKAKQVFVL